MSKQTEREELTAHTPGPWDTEYNSCYDRFEIRSLKQGIFGHFCGWYSDGVATEQEDKANARLIAAAPELLAENKRLRALVQRWREVIAGHEKNAEGWAKEFESESRAALAGSKK